jgi:hypothetical protein
MSKCSQIISGRLRYNLPQKDGVDKPFYYYEQIIFEYQTSKSSSTEDSLTL